ncbi:hypothetical protein HanPI659440_Chr00c03g0710951 [Helianthus annuus]|nr:hypothetical protein HanPI659440_Chr00c03g0710951 [Helianthus annuus]
MNAYASKMFHAENSLWYVSTYLNSIIFIHSTRYVSQNRNQFHADKRIYASKSSPKRLKKSKESQKVANPQLAEISLDEQNGISDKSSPTNSVNNLESQASVAIASRSSVLQACTLTSGFIAFTGVIIRQGSHLASSQGWPIADCSSEISSPIKKNLG